MKKTKLSTTILKSVSARVLIVIIISSSLSYLHLYNTIAKGAKETLQKYVSERGKREDSLFLLAQNNHQVLKAEALKRFAGPVTKEELLRFDKLLRRLPDGTVRNKRESYDGTKMAGVFIPANVKISDDLKHRIIIMIDLVETFGKAFRSQFQDTYFTTSENIMVLYWPEVPNWTMEMKADFNMLEEEYGWVANKINNPERVSKWTGAFYDIVGKTWMASLETPIDGEGWSVTIGHDVMLDELVSRVSSEQLEGTYNVIFRKDGRLVAHPRLLSDLKQEKLDLLNIDDLFLKQMYEAALKKSDQLSQGAIVIEHPDGNNFIAITKIRGPEWLFVTVYPHVLITSAALNGISFILILALASLAFEIMFLYYGLKRDVVGPLQKLEDSVRKISEGEYQARLDMDRTDELGQLAESFNIMGKQISDHEKSLIQKVEERTRQVDEQRAILIQKSKLASLGEMAGGIAHEINTPLAIIGMKVEQLMESVEENSLDNEELTSSLKVIKSTNDRIAKIISGLRFVVRDGSQMPMEPVLVSFLIDETCSFCKEKMRLSDIEFSIVRDFPSDLKITCRSVEISQVLLNILNNAIDAVMDHPEKRISLHTSVDEDNIIFRISDSGPGISPEIREKVMQPFFTTKALGKGTGLGLSISRGIIEAHKGRFYIDNESSSTCFVIVLPLKEIT